MLRNACLRLLLGAACVSLSAGCALRQGKHAPGHSAGLDHLSWMSGIWATETADGRSEEQWMLPRGGTMIGMNRTVDGGKTSFFEFLRMESRPDGVYYVASPLGKCETAFRMVEGGACGAPTALAQQCVEFANPEHDYPQRILYRRLSGGRLIAVIEGTREGQPAREEFRWRRQRR